VFFYVIQWFTDLQGGGKRDPTDAAWDVLHEESVLASGD
jgi:hypothetical protein